MSDLYMHECFDIAWDEFCPGDDRIVPDPTSKRINCHFILEDSEKKHRHEIASNSSNAGDRSVRRYVDQKGYQGGISPLSKRRNTMLEKDSWSYKPDRAGTSAFHCDPDKEASNIASDSTSANGLKRNHRNSNSGEFSGLDTILDDKTSIVYNNSFNYPMGGINHASNDINYFENAENKDSSDLLYCDWTDIENFEDIDRMFRNCDSTFGLGICRKDELLDWLSSDDTGGAGDVLKSDVKFPYLESSEVENISENHDFSNGYSINNTSMISSPITHKDSSRTSEKPESCRSYVIGPDIADNKVGFVPQEEQLTRSEFNNEIQPSISANSHSRSGSAAVTNEHNSHIKQEKQSEGNGNEHYPGNYRFSQVTVRANESGKLSSGLTSVQTQPLQRHESSPDSYSYSQNRILYMQSDNDRSSGLSSVMTNDLTLVSPEDSSHSSSQLQYMEGFPNPDLETAEQRKMLNCHQVNLSSLHDCPKDGSVTAQSSMTMTDPGLSGKYETHCNAAEIGSSNIQESSTVGPDLDDISLEAASFRQLQVVMTQLDLRTKLCIRDSLYRLARSAKQRHNLANTSSGCGEGDDKTKRYTSFMDMETDTNPIDRSVAHLLFHHPSDSSTQPAQDLLPFQSSSAVIGSITGPPVLDDNLVSEENVSQVEKVSDC